MWALHHAPDLSVAGILMKEHGFAYIMCDECLPDHSGHARLEVVHEIRNATKLIVTTATEDVRLWAEALNVGAHGVLP